MKASLFSLFALSMIILGCKSSSDNKIQYYTIDGNAWQLEILTGDLNTELLVYATYDGRICLFDPSDGRKEWEYQAGAFIFDLKTSDVDGDGEEEIFAVTAGNQLIGLNREGQHVWSYTDKTPLYSIGIGDVDPDSPGLEVVTGGISRKVMVFSKDGQKIHSMPGMERLIFRIAIVDLDHDAQKDIIAIENRTVAHAIGIREGVIQTLWRKPISVPDEYINWENPRGRFYPFSLTTSDLDQDGIEEIIGGDTFFNKQSVLVSDNQANPIWISERLPPFDNRPDSQTEFYSTAFVKASDLIPALPGKEILAVSGGNFRMFDMKGNLLGEEDCIIGFTDFEIVGNKIYLSSSPNGDNQLYELNIDGSWQQTVRNIQRKGKIKRIGENLSQLRQQVLNYDSDQIPDRSYFINLSFESLQTTEEGLLNNRKIRDWFKDRFPYSNIRLLNTMKVIESSPPLDENGDPWFEYRWSVDAINGTMTVDEIIEKAEFIEKNRIPTLFYIGHSCMPFITLETAEKILQAAPNYCVGFQTSEDETLDLIPRYFKYYFGPLADLCVQYGYKLAITKNKGLWWLSSPANREVFDALFSGERKKVVVAATEDSNSRTPEINLLSRGGLWQAGLLQHNEVSIHSDLFSFNRFFQWEYPKTGSPFLRLMVAHTTLGMTQFNARIKEIYPEKEGFAFNNVGSESTEIYYHMLGKGIVFSPQPEQVLGYNPVGIVIHQPPQAWLIDAHNGHAPEKWEHNTVLQDAILPHNGCLWGMTNTPDHALQRNLLSKTRQFGYQIPSTPYGLIAFLPAYADLKKVSGIREWWHTDGVSIWSDSDTVRIKGMEAAEKLRAAFEKGAKKMPFLVEGYAFLNTLQMGKNRFRLFLIDPGYLDPSEREVKVKIQMDGECSAYDLLSNTKVAVSPEKDFTLEIPAGSIRIIEVMNEAVVTN